MNTASKYTKTFRSFAETFLIVLFLPVFGFVLMTKPRRQTQAIGSAFFVMGSMLWILTMIAVTCST